MLSLPESERAAFAEPLGDIYTDADELLAAADPPVVTVGDVVVHHLRSAGHDPHVTVTDGRTERAAADESVRRSSPEPDRTVENAPGGISRDLLVAVRDAVAADGSTAIAVDGEEDLAALPAVLVTPLGGSVVYGQPGDGMVFVPVTVATRGRARDLFGRLAGDVDAALAVLGADNADN